MVAYPASDIALRIGDGGSPTESFTLVEGLQVVQMQLEQKLVDANSVAHSAWTERLAAGMRAITVRGEGVMTDSAAELALQSAALGGLKKNFQLIFGNGQVVEGPFMISQFERGGSIGEIEHYAIVLSSCGDISLT